MTLIEKLKAADGPSRELDAEIAVWLGLVFEDGENAFGETRYSINTEGGVVRPGSRPDMLIGRYTASIDTALALVAEKLPGWVRDVDATAPECGVDVRLHSPLPRQKGVIGTHPSEPLATIIALLTALEGEQG